MEKKPKLLDILEKKITSHNDIDTESILVISTKHCLCNFPFGISLMK